MTQLIINNNIALPEARFDAYSANEEELSSQLTMISGRMVEEKRGKVWVISYKKCLDDTTWRAIKPFLMGGSFPIRFLPDDGDSLIPATVLCTVRPTPSFAFAKSGKAYWQNISFTLREVRPHD